MHALEQEIGKDRFHRYFAPGSASLEVSAEGVTIRTPNKFLGQWLRNWVDPALDAVLRQHAANTNAKPLPVLWQVVPELWNTPHAGGSAGIHAAHNGPPHPAAQPGQEPTRLATERQAWHRGSGDPNNRWPTGSRNNANPHDHAWNTHHPNDEAPRQGIAPRGTQGTPPGTSPTGRWRRPDATRYRLEDFVVGDSNRLGFTAACSLASPDSNPGFRALVLHGSCGLGKTHLLSGVLGRVIQRHPDARVRYVTAEQFANEFIASIGNHDVARFRQRYRGLDLLCIDDVHFLAGKQKTMAELEHTFESLDLAGARVVMASDAHPSQIADFSRRLTARLAGAVAVQLHKPDRATRLKIVEKLALERGLMIDASTVQTIADACVESVREIQGALAKLEALAAHARLEDPDANPRGLISASLARRAVAEDISGRVTRPIRVDTIAEVVCRGLRVDMSEVLGSGRHKRVVLARSICAWLARQLTAHSFPEIARSLHRPSHSTIVTQCQKVQRQIDDGDLVDAGPEFDGVRLADLCERLRNEVLRRPAE